MSDSRVLIIGSGPTGAAAALFLARAGVDVTVLEAGLERRALGLTAKVAGFTVARVHRRLSTRTVGVTMTGDAGTQLYEEIAPGGLTNHWSCAVPRFSQEDFDDAARAGEEYRWPIGYDDLAPWYDRVEPLLHISGATSDTPHLPAGRVRHPWHLCDTWDPVVESGPRLGRSVVPLPYTYGSDTTLTPSGTVFNAFTRLLKPLEREGRVQVRYGAQVTRLVWSKERRGVEAVVFRDATTGQEHTMRAAAVVVAAGAVNTARILLQSTSDEFPDGLGNTHGVLGRYLHDHPLGKIVISVSRPLGFRPPAYVSRASLESSRPLYAAAGVQWTGASLAAKAWLARTPRRLPWVGMNVFGTMAPTRDNYVALDEQHRDPDGAAGLVLHVRHPEESTRLLNDSRDQLLALFEDAGLRPSLGLWKVEPVGGSVHFGGTARMHASPEHGMVDAWSRLHAVRNVMVADSAAFTTGPEKNPVLTAMVLAARGSARLAEDLRRAAA